MIWGFHRSFHAFLQKIISLIKGFQHFSATISYVLDIRSFLPLDVGDDVPDWELAKRADERDILRYYGVKNYGVIESFDFLRTNYLILFWLLCFVWYTIMHLLEYIIS